MVSHLDFQQQLVAQPRAPPSVSSRASSSRRHRHNRSHHGAQNEFPTFAQTGDVEITITSVNGRKEQRYILHRLILSQCSGFFEVDTRHDITRAIMAGPTTSYQQQPLSNSSSHSQDRTSSSSDLASLRSGSGQAERRRWKYVLDWGNVEHDDIPRLVQRQPTTASVRDSQPPPPVSRNKPPTSSNSFFRSMSNFSALNLNDQQTNRAPDADDELLKDHENLFRIFYNYAPSLNSVSIADAYTECKALLRLAEMYDALDVVGPRIDHHLLRFGNRLFKQIAKYPPSYLKLGYLAQSKTIFAESLIHVVGQWPIHRPQLERAIDPIVLDLIEDKFDMLNETKHKVEGKLFRLTLTTSRGERVSPSNSFLDWLAMSLFRQWLAENTTPRPVSILKDGPRPGSAGTATSSQLTAVRPSRSNAPTTVASTRTPTAPEAAGPSPARIYRLISSTNKEAYLPRDELKRFLKHAPEGLYSRDNVRRFERRMDELKNLARDAVKPLTRNCLELDFATAGLGDSNSAAGLSYLTCTKVAEEDFPWDE